MSEPSGLDVGAQLLALYDEALPSVYGYLLSRCGQVALAEDLTAETVLAAVDAARRESPPPISTAWLVGVARHKLVDHWRRQAREEHVLREAAEDELSFDDPWDAHLDVLRARAAKKRLGPHHHTTLTLRYFDDLPVAEVAMLLGRTVHASEGLLARARAAVRGVYEGREMRDA